MNFEERINAGLEGRFKGLDNGLNKTNKYLFGIQRSCYYLIGALSGGGKTTLVDFMLLNAIRDAFKQGIKINIHYYSFEIDEVSKKANWLSSLIFKKYNRVIPPEKIKGFGNLRLDLEEQALVRDLLPELDEIWSKVNWYWEANNPTGMNKEIFHFMEKRGEFEKTQYTNELGEVKDKIVKFIPKDATEYNIVVVDHIYLLKRESKSGKMFDAKENIDKWSEYCVRLRNLFGMTIFNIQQFNQGLSSIDRAKYKGVDIAPQHNDFKDTTNPFQDCDVAIGLMNAYKMDMQTCLGYNINVAGAPYNLKDRFRMLRIIKNRLSRDGLSIGLLFLPESNEFSELPYPKDFTTQDYEKINKLVKER